MSLAVVRGSPSFGWLLQKFVLQVLACLLISLVTHLTLLSTASAGQLLEIEPLDLEKASSIASSAGTALRCLLPTTTQVPPAQSLPPTRDAHTNLQDFAMPGSQFMVLTLPAPLILSKASYAQLLSRDAEGC